MAQIIVTGATIVGRAFTRALRQEIVNSQQAAKARQSRKEGSRSAAQSALSGMALQVCRINQIIKISLYYANRCKVHK